MKFFGVPALAVDSFAVQNANDSENVDFADGSVRDSEDGSADGSVRDFGHVLVVAAAAVEH